MGQVPLLYEELVPFDFEVSIIGARSRSGEIAIYPLNGNVHGGGILRLTRAPYGSPTLQRYAMDPQKPIRIVVDNGKVTLLGVVDSDMDKQIAGVQANSVPGVFSVDNQLLVLNSKK